jgi:hydroxymethylcytosylglucuronate/cytosylglucuronate synthase
MTAKTEYTLLAAICDFGWGSLGKFRLIIDELDACSVLLYGSADINHIATALLGSRHSFGHGSPERADVAIVINDPAAANQIGALGVPVIYVDSLPYLWANDEEVPHRESVAYYCAQKFPADRLPVSSPLKNRRVHWIDPIVPASAHRSGGHGIVINLGGLHSHLVGDTVDAYLRLILYPLIAELKASGREISGVCGNLPADVCRRVESLLPGCSAIGPQTPYDFEALLKNADLLITSPGSTTILQAISLKLPSLLLPPQNLSQILNAQIYSWPGAPIMRWPASVMTMEAVAGLRPQGEDAALGYIYQSISDAARSTESAADVLATIRSTLCTAPPQGVLDPSISGLGQKGAAQVAQLVKQALLAPIPRPK